MTTAYLPGVSCKSVSTAAAPRADNHRRSSCRHSGSKERASRHGGRRGSILFAACSTSSRCRQTIPSIPPARCFHGRGSRWQSTIVSLQSATESVPAPSSRFPNACRPGRRAGRYSTSRRGHCCCCSPSMSFRQLTECTTVCTGASSGASSSCQPSDGSRLSVRVATRTSIRSSPEPR